MSSSAALNVGGADRHRPPTGERAPSVGIMVSVFALVMIVDGFDIFIMGTIAPQVAEDFGIAPSALTLTFFLQQIGIAAGSFLGGPVAGRAGPRAVLLVCLAAFSALSLACMAAQNIWTLAVLRGLSGVFLGGVVPTVLALASERAPAPMRGRILGLLLVGYTVGPIVAAVFTGWMQDSWGWRAAFLLGGVLPLACLLFVAWAIPESATFREQQGRSQDGKRLAVRAGLAQVIAEGRAVGTIVLCMSFFLALGVNALGGAWLPTFYEALADVPASAFAKALAFGGVGSVLSTLLVGVLLDRFPPLSVLIVCQIFLTLSSLSLAFVPYSGPPLAAALLARAFFTGAVCNGLLIFATAFYPLEVRPTGLSLAVGAGRVGGIIFPLFGGLLVASSLGLESVLILISLPLIGILVLLVWLELTRRRRGDGILGVTAPRKTLVEEDPA